MNNLQAWKPDHQTLHQTLPLVGAKGIQKAAEELDILKLSKDERAAYDTYIEDRRIGESSIKTSWIEGKIEGKIEIAIEMIKDGELNDKIKKYTGLSDDDINGLRKAG